MVITYDPAKPAKTIAERQLDFEDAKLVFEATSFETEDTRKDYGEKRIICFGIQRSHGCRWLHPAWRGSPCVQHEKS